MVEWDQPEAFRGIKVRQRRKQAHMEVGKSCKTAFSSVLQLNAMQLENFPFELTASQDIVNQLGWGIIIQQVAQCWYTQLSSCYVSCPKWLPSMKTRVHACGHKDRELHCTLMNNDIMP